MGKGVSEIYCESLTYPFCTATTYYRLNGNDDTPEKFGSNCCEQVRRLNRALSVIGARNYYYLDKRANLHYTLIHQEEGAEFLLDPYLLQTGPIEVPTKEGDVVRAKSRQSDEKIEIVLERKASSLLVRRYSQGFSNDDVFEYNVDDKLTYEFTYDEQRDVILAANVPPLIRVFNHENNTILSLVYHRKKDNFKTASEDGFARAGSEDFERDLETICRQIGSDEEEIKHYLREANRISEELRKKV